MKTSFVRSVATVAGGTATSQLIGILFSPLITRIYGPEAYGIQGVFITLVGLFSTGAALTYPLAIVLPKNDVDAIQVAKLSAVLAVVSTLILSVFLFFYGREFLTLVNADALQDFVFLIPLAVLATVIFTILSQWMVRQGEFLAMSKVGVLTSLTSNLLKVGFGYVNPAAIVLISIAACGRFLQAILAAFYVRRPGILSNDRVSYLSGSTKLWKQARTYQDFALWRTPQAIISSLGRTFPIVLLAGLSGPAAAGFYGIAVAVLAVPANLIGESVRQVFYPKITETIYGRQKARSLIIKTTLGMAMMGAIPCMVVAVAGPWLFSLVFGNEWQMAGRYAQWLSLLFFLQFTNVPAVAAVPVLGLQRGLFVYELSSTIVKLAVLVLGFKYFEDSVLAVASFSIAGVAAYLWLITWIIYRSNHSIRPMENNF